MTGVTMAIFPYYNLHQYPFATCRASVSFKSISPGHQQHQVLAAVGQTANALKALNLRWFVEKGAPFHHDNHWEKHEEA